LIEFLRREGFLSESHDPRISRNRDESSLQVATEAAVMSTHDTQPNIAHDHYHSKASRRKAIRNRDQENSSMKDPLAWNYNDQHNAPLPLSP
jgi:hypothetical protein